MNLVTNAATGPYTNLLTKPKVSFKPNLDDDAKPLNHVHMADADSAYGTNSEKCGIRCSLH